MTTVLATQERLMIEEATSTVSAVHPADNEILLQTEVAEMDLHKHLTRSHMMNPTVNRKY
jgi:hypothetical protein